ncbi:guanine nucleotide exchange factor synembryn-domain-containing protein, partial [Syncephalis pseudoplumigaleata]
MERYLAADDGRAGGALGDAAAVLALLTEIEEAAAQQASLPGKTYVNLTERQQLIDRLLRDMESTAVWSTWTPEVRLAALRVLKIQCRDRTVAGSLFKSKSSSDDGGASNQSMSLGHVEWEREALKCVANAMLLEESTRELFVDAQASEIACQWLQCRFILLRLLFLVTVADIDHCRYLVDQLSIVSILGQFLQPNYTDAMDMMTTSECLKLLYNLCMHLPKTEASPDLATDQIPLTLSERSRSASSLQEAGGAAGPSEDAAGVSAPTSPASPLSKSIQSSRNALTSLQQRLRRLPIGRKRSNSVTSCDSRASSGRTGSPSRSDDIGEEERKRLIAECVQRKVALKFESILLTWRPLTNGNPLVPPYSHAVHALLHFPVVAPFKSTWFPGHASRPYAIVEQLIYITNLTLSERNLDGGANERQIDEGLLPLLTLLVALARGDEEAKLRLRTAFIPDIIDRSQPVHQGDTLSARIIRAMTAPFLTRSRNMVSEFLYILHDENPDALVERVGFGNVAGFFVMRGIQFKPPSQSSMVDAATGQAVNPITGQRVDAQPSTSAAEMTQEEKEREAERLFVLFDRLNRTGVVKAVNPVAEAVASGRFE